MNWEYRQPVTILFGKGKSREIGRIARDRGYGRGLLVADPFFEKSGLARAVMDSSEGVLADSFTGVSPNPEAEEVDACARQLRDQKLDFVVALGGGSALDCAKAAAGIALSGQSIRRYHGTGEPLPREHLPVIAVPTTAGTGSEVTCVAVISDHARGLKAPIVSETFYPACAVVDPELTYTVPPAVTAGTGIDVLCHALEGFWSRGHQPICDALALHAAKLVFGFLPRAWACPTDEEAREKMCEASLIAGLAFTLPKTTAPHACSFPLTNRYHIPHGEACGLTLDWFTRINAGGEEGRRLEDFAAALGYGNALGLADAIRELKQQLRLRTDLKDLHLSREEVRQLAADSHHPNLLNNPVQVTDEMLWEMYSSLAL